MRFGGGIIAGISVVAAAAGSSVPARAQERQTPYFASIAAGKARMRTGPGRNYPISWLYERADLPIKVVDIYQDWRKVEDPDGTQGWMQVGLLSARRTAIVTGSITPMRAAPQASATVEWRAAPGVVGRITDCKGGWCYFDVHGRAGYIEESHLWGVGPGEEF